MTTDLDVVSPFCTGSDHRLIRLRLQLSDDLFYASSRKRSRQNTELDPDAVRVLMDLRLPDATASYDDMESTIVDIQTKALRTAICTMKGECPSPPDSSCEGIAHSR